jgi:hypothetical protein
LLHDELSEAGNSPFLVLQKGIPRLDRVYYYNYEDATEAKQVEEERKKNWNHSAAASSKVNRPATSSKAY